MVQDPYKVLGLSPGASEEEIKKAYRRKSKEYHPDLHPDDPTAAQKMAEVNEAYDMLMNPEKYAKRQQQEPRHNTGYGQSSSSQSQGHSAGGYQGPGGWSSDFSGFDFGDLFGFGFEEASQVSPPQAQAGDSPEIRQAIVAIQNRQYSAAINILNRVVSSGRNARWYYLSAWANNGAGNTVLALEQIRRAVQMEPNNRDYQRLLQRFQQTGQTYQQGSQGFHMDPSAMGKCCMGLCVANLLCRCCAGGMYF
ncbi:MAG: DnaJ domain-containing protein [Oscillospiraceae bacterium]